MFTSESPGFIRPSPGVQGTMSSPEPDRAAPATPEEVAGAVGLG
jgi:hypothetical protein